MRANPPNRNRRRSYVVIWKRARMGREMPVPLFDDHCETSVPGVFITSMSAMQDWVCLSGSRSRCEHRLN